MSQYGGADLDRAGDSRRVGLEGRGMRPAKEKKDDRGCNMKWQSFLSNFILDKMCVTISNGVRTHKDFKAVHLNSMANQVFELCGQGITSTYVYNHLRKWRMRKRKRVGFLEEELTIFSSMNRAVKEVAIDIRESKTADVHPEFYDVVMEQGGFSPEALMVALCHLLDKKVAGVVFVAVGEAYIVLWLRIWLGKHYY
ncbi:hypothetical protein D1007_20155 [Hordeum vulgare]|nr:hypothetical protein D1007_20155 [Hordeum vulgare]